MWDRKMLIVYSLLPLGGFQARGQMDKAEFECAEIIFRHLVEAGREDLANDLAMALMNKALALEKLEEWDEALECYELAIRHYLFCVEDRGMLHVYPMLLKTIRYRLATLIELERQEEAEEDLERYRPLIENLPELGAQQDQANEHREAIIEMMKKQSG
jgi:tetratricopeptide (TPR) repeat protein